MAMYGFKKPAFSRSVMFAVNYEDGRTAYLVVQNHGTSGPGLSRPHHRAGAPDTR